MKASVELKGDMPEAKEKSEQGPTLKVMHGTVVERLWQLEG